MRYLKTTILAAVVTAALSGCGDGGDGGGGSVPDTYRFPPGKATVTFSAISSAHLPAPISGIVLSVILPQGMSVTTDQGSSGTIATQSITPGSALLPGTSIAYGTYSASNGKTRLTTNTPSDTFRSGEFLRLTCVVASNTNITLGSLKAQNSPVTVLKAVGYDSTTNSTVDLTGKLTATLGAIR